MAYPKSNANLRITFYEQLLGDVEVRNRIDTVEKANGLIDSMENEIPHDKLPVCYDWLVARRNRLESESTSNTVETLLPN